MVTPNLLPSLWALHDLATSDCAFSARSLGVFGHHWTEEERKYSFTEQMLVPIPKLCFHTLTFI